MAKLKTVYDTEEDIPVEYKDLYELRNDKWTLTGIEGIQTSESVRKLEATIATLRTEAKGMKTKISGFTKTPEEIEALESDLAETKALLEAGSKPDDAKINEIVELRIKGKMAPHERELKQTKDLLDLSTLNGEKLQGILTKGKIEDALRKAGAESKIRSTALEDFTLLGQQIFEVVEVDGHEVIQTKDSCGYPPGLSPADFIPEIAPRRPHWWESSQGAGSTGGRGGPNFNGSNPWSRENWNVTEQMKFYTANGAEKAALAAKQAGSSVGAPLAPAVKK